jgi:hypothetical protein
MVYVTEDPHQFVFVQWNDVLVLGNCTLVKERKCVGRRWN